MTPDRTLDVEFAYTDWRNSCRDLYGLDHGGVDLRCRRPGGHDDEHACGFGAGRVRWHG